MFQTHMVGHLWDLVDEGLEGVLDLLHGTLGVTGLCTPVTAGPMRSLRYAADVEPRIFRSRGGVFFQPDRALYENTRCKPILSEWLKTRNPLQKLAQSCRERGLALRAVIECTSIGRIAAHDPHFARKDVFGDLSPSQICLVNADVAEFIRASALDVCKNYALDTLELTGLDAMTPAAEDPAGEPGLGGRQLLALCFCESCKQAAAAAGVDVEAAARSTTVRLDTVFRTGQPITPPLTTIAADDPPLSAFLAWYHARITELLSTIRSLCGCRILVHTGPRHAGNDEEFTTEYASGVDGVVCDFVGWETTALERLIARMRLTPGTAQRLEVQLPV
ncbi:MAG: hypothetical protein V2A79_01785, partial [Planctomycetota bacterium]